jgi:ribose transport system substrate-binding protein
LLQADEQKEAIKYIMDTDFYGCNATSCSNGKNAVEACIQHINAKEALLKNRIQRHYYLSKKMQNNI